MTCDLIVSLNNHKRRNQACLVMEKRRKNNNNNKKNNNLRYKSFFSWTAKRCVSLSLIPFQADVDPTSISGGSRPKDGQGNTTATERRCLR